MCVVEENMRLGMGREWSVLGGGGSAGRLFQGGACVTVDQLDLSAWQPKQQGSYAPVAHQMRVQCTAERIMPMIPTPPFCDPLQWGNQSGLVEGIAHVLGQPINMPLAAGATHPEQQTGNQMLAYCCAKTESALASHLCITVVDQCGTCKGHAYPSLQSLRYPVMYTPMRFI